jgi:type VI secretion system secreted protein Hcp
MALFDAFLKLDGIKGESADAKHKGEIDIKSFSWGMSQSGVQATGGGGGAGKVKVHDFSITKTTDASSPLLFLNCASGAHIKEANFVVRKAGGEQLEYLKIKLTDVLVSSYKPATVGPSIPGSNVEGSASRLSGPGDEGPEERVTLNFAKVEFQYQAQGADGKAQGGPIMAGWDVKANQKI